VISISTGTMGPVSDFLSGFYGNANVEVARVCTHLKGLAKLKDGFTLVGFSQGGQFGRAVVQRCKCAAL
jgi:palmitoyl-protein thioesterase